MKTSMRCNECDENDEGNGSNIPGINEIKIDDKSDTLKVYWGCSKIKFFCAFVRLFYDEVRHNANALGGGWVWM
jgi:hypothetical protein